jgi:hypothetical protein
LRALFSGLFRSHRIFGWGIEVTLSRAVSAAIFAVCACWAIPAAAATYQLSGDAAGVSKDLTTNGPINTFSSVHVELDLFGSGSATNVAGVGIYVPVGSADLLALGQTATISDVPPQFYFRVGEGANLGQGAFGTYDGTTFTPDFTFTGSGLDGYNGVSPLAPVPVDITQLSGFQITNPVSGDTIGIQFESFSNDWTFAAVPEPATWTLLLGGFGLAWFLLRRRARSVPARA